MAESSKHSIFHSQEGENIERPSDILRSTFCYLAVDKFTSLVSQAWELFQERKTLELVDSSLENYDADEAAMCIQLGLLCCQSTVSDRPDMNSVNLALSSDSFTLPRPGKPAIQGRVSRWTTDSSSAFTKNTTATNASSTVTGATNATTTTRVSEGSSFVEDFSRNSISCSSINEGR